MLSHFFRSYALFIYVKNFRRIIVEKLLLVAGVQCVSYTLLWRCKVIVAKNILCCGGARSLWQRISYVVEVQGHCGKGYPLHAKQQRSDARR